MKFMEAGNIKMDIRDRILLPYTSSKRAIRKFKIDGIKKWRIFKKSSLKPHNVPSNPYEAYKNKGWVSWYDFLGKEDPRKTKETL